MADVTGKILLLQAAVEGGNVHTAEACKNLDKELDQLRERRSVKRRTRLAFAGRVR
jgi:hypothetical protein